MAQTTIAAIKSRTQTPAPPTTSIDPTHPPLPPASHFDILPPLHALLSRLEPSQNIYTPAPSSTIQDDATAANGTQLNYKDAAVAAGFLKARIRKLLVELKGLEDMERSVEEQEDEISRLERKIEEQREVLIGLGVEAGKMSGHG